MLQFRISIYCIWQTGLETVSVVQQIQIAAWLSFLRPTALQWPHCRLEGLPGEQRVSCPLLTAQVWSTDFCGLRNRSEDPHQSRVSHERQHAAAPGHCWTAKRLPPTIYSDSTCPSSQFSKSPFLKFIFGTRSFSRKQEQLRQKCYVCTESWASQENFKNLNADKKRNVTFLQTFLLKRWIAPYSTSPYCNIP